MPAQLGLSFLPVTIAAGQSLSPQIDIGPGKLAGIVVPANWTAASLTFQVSPDGGTTWFEHYSSAGSETIFTAAAGDYLAVDQTLWQGVVSLKLRSGTVGTPVNQTNSAVLQLAVKLN